MEVITMFHISLAKSVSESIEGGIYEVAELPLGREGKIFIALEH